VRYAGIEKVNPEKLQAQHVLADALWTRLGALGVKTGSEGRIESVSGHIADLLRREDDWRDARATLDRIFERCPGPEAKHYDWARQALGVGAEPAR